MIRGCFISLAAMSLALFATGCTGNGNQGPTNPMSTATGNIVDVATGSGMDEVTTLVKALKAADLVDTLKGPGPYTVFAPTNAAFEKLPAGALDDLLKPENKEKLRKVLLTHVVLGRHDSDELRGMKDLKTVEGATLKLKVSDQRLTVGNDNGMASVVRADINASNGVIHWVDTVLMP